MKLKFFFISLAMLVLPVSVYAVSEQSQGTSNGNSANSGSSVSGQDSVSSVNNQAENQIQTQTQTNNSGTGVSTQTQTEEQTKISEEINESKPKYAPANSKSAEHKNEVAAAVQNLIQASYQIENKGLGDQIRTIAQNQSKNQDKIGQSVDKVEKRTAFAKFFIGANYKELAAVKQAMEENKTQIQSLAQLMEGLTSDADKVEVANQIIALQNNQIELREQLSDLSSGFSLFGWIARWKNNF